MAKASNMTYGTGRNIPERQRRTALFGILGLANAMRYPACLTSGPMALNAVEQNGDHRASQIARTIHWRRMAGNFVALQCARPMALLPMPDRRLPPSLTKTTRALLPHDE